MDIITVDFETFYGDDYTLSKLTTEAYVRDPRFETILCGFKVNGERGWWVPRDDIPRALADLQLERRAVIAHHAHFDGLILSYHYGLAPKVWFDTLGMARALHGQHGRLSLEKLAERYNIGRKGHEVLHAKNLRFADFSPTQLRQYGGYCVNDCDLEWELFNRMVGHFSKAELTLNDRVIRMFTEPRLRLDAATLQAYADALRVEKQTLMLQAGVQEADLMSNDKFAQCLEDLGVEPPRKISPTFLKKPEQERNAYLVANPIPTTWAFAKSDPEMQELQEHPDERVQMLVEARLKNKTTIAEKGALRLIGMGSRGPATVYLKFSGAAGTHRLSGGDLFNWQSMKRGSPLRNAVLAPDGYVCVVVDSSTIEARMLDWLAGQEDMVDVYRKQDAKTGPDMYCTIAERIYKRPITKAEDPDERQMGKVAKLGLGFGMGPGRFKFAVRAQAKDKNGKPLRITDKFSEEVVGIYRESHPQVRKLWKRCERALECIAQGIVNVDVDFRGIVKTCKDGLVLPGGIRILYPELRMEQVGQGQREWTFWNGKMREHIYGAKMVENIIQCLARTTVMYQCIDAEKEVRPVGASWVHSVHDEGVFVSPTFEGPWVLERITSHMRTSPWFAPDLPVNCEGGFHQRYGKAKS